MKIREKLRENAGNFEMDSLWVPCNMKILYYTCAENMTRHTCLQVTETGIKERNMKVKRAISKIWQRYFTFVFVLYIQISRVLFDEKYYDNQTLVNQKL